MKQSSENDLDTFLQPDRAHFEHDCLILGVSADFPYFNAVCTPVRKENPARIACGKNREGAVCEGGGVPFNKKSKDLQRFPGARSWVPGLGTGVPRPGYWISGLSDLSD